MNMMTNGASARWREPRNPKPRDRRDAPAAVLATPENPADFPRIYASTTVGDCMAPLLTEGCDLVFDKEAACGAGDVVAIWFHPHAVRPGAHSRMVKRLVMGLAPGLTFPFSGWKGNVAPLVIVEMLNPPRQFYFRAEDVLAMHRCIGVAETIGNGRAVMTQRFNDSGELEPVMVGEAAA